MKKIAISLSKGGVGKTTTAVHLAAGLAQTGHKVLLIDTDTQGQCSTLLGQKPQWGLAEFVNQTAPLEQALTPCRDNLWLLAGGEKLAGLNRLIAQEQFGGERILSESLNTLSEDYDFIVIDTAPGWDALSINTLFYVDEIICPTTLEVMSLQGLVEFIKRIEKIQEFRHALPILKHILPISFDRRTAISKEILEKLQQYYGDKVVRPIRYSIRFVELASFGQTIFEYAPKGTGAQDYKMLVKRIAHET